jgi:hypothetical protein
MEKSKKAIANQNILSFGEKVAKLPRIESVTYQICVPSSEKRN